MHFQVMSKQINNELEEQSVMLDDLGNEMDSAQNRVDIALKKMAKVFITRATRFLYFALIILLIVSSKVCLRMIRPDSGPYQTHLEK